MLATKICAVETCGEKHMARGYCHRHYKQIKKYGKITHVLCSRTTNTKVRKERPKSSIDHLEEWANEHRIV